VFSARAAFEHLSEEDQQRLDDINLVLDQQIRPFLQSDGGDLDILSLVGNQLVVHYQGACGTCPSSISGTLQAIERQLRTLEPDLEVIAA
jgi:Fe-S cluster biogenesis protein NfuA